MNKKLLILLLLSSTCVASVPIKDSNGCNIGSRGSTSDTIPFYLVGGKYSFNVTTYKLKCPPIVKEKTEIKIPFGKVVGHLEHVFNDTYITVPTKKEIKYFPTRDVFVEETNEWSFKDLRSK